MPPIRRASVLAAIAVLGAACATGGTSAPPGDTPPASADRVTDPGSGADGVTPGGAAESSPGGGSAGDAGVLAFTAPTLDGGTFDGAAYAGQDVILWMWAPW